MSTIVVRATRRQQIRVLFTVSVLRLGTEPDVQWRSIFFRMIVELESTREKTNLVYQWGSNARARVYRESDRWPAIQNGAFGEYVDSSYH